jgi:serine/threonine-protein kinase
MTATANAAAPAKAGGFRLSLSTSIFLLSVVLLAAAVGSAVLITWWQGKKLAGQAIERAQQLSAEVQSELAQRSLEDVQLKVQLIAADAAFVKYVNDAQGGGLGLGSDVPVDAGSIGDLLNERQESFRFDIGLVLDPQGAVLARTDQSEAYEQSLRGDPFIEAALREASPFSGYWRQSDKLYQAAIFPLAQDQDLIGFLLLGLEVNDAVGARVGKASGAAVAFVLPRAEGAAIIGSSFDAPTKQALSELISSTQSDLGKAIQEGSVLERVSLRFAGQDWVGKLAPVDADGGSRLGSVLQLSSLDEAGAGYRSILNVLAAAGLAALLAALPLSYLLARISLRPLKNMAKAAVDAAAGNYQTQFSVGGKDELARLSQAFDRLLSDLREKSDIEGYVTNLSRFLPDPGQEAPVPSFVTQRSDELTTAPTPRPPTRPPKREAMLLLGLDLRGFARPLDGQTADAALAQVNERSAGLIGLARRYGGRILTSTGTRALLGFGGPQRLLCALHMAFEATMMDNSVAAALIEGEIAHGTVSSGEQTLPSAVGPACYQVERLLSESGPGKVLLPRGLGDTAKALLGESKVGVAAGLISTKPFYAISTAELGDLPPAPPPVAALLDDGLSTVEQPLARSAAPSSSGTRPSRGGDLVPGMRLGGRYDILSVLGQGGMGVVYRARDIELDDVVALKMLKPSALVDSEHLERLKSEIKLARKITHPNVLRTFDFGEAHGMPYVSMEYVRGMTLRYLLRQAGRIPYSAALRIARQLCAGLEAAHAVGVLHRDVKPENLIIEASGNAKLMDFGIARPIRRTQPGQTQPGMFVGTPHYSAPEQLAGDDVDHRADIYSSGVLLCETFCGKLPFDGANTMEIYMAQMQQAPIKPSDHWPEIPKALEAIILKCIERRPEQRYQSVAELAAALGELRA